LSLVAANSTEKARAKTLAPNYSRRGGTRSLVNTTPPQHSSSTDAPKPEPLVTTCHTVARTSQIGFLAIMALEGCVSSLRSSMQLLDASINILDEGVNDFPRLSKVLQTTRVCIECPKTLRQHSTNSTSTLSSSQNPTSNPPNLRSSPKSAPKSKASFPV
jgi:hypothetical protein